MAHFGLGARRPDVEAFLYAANHDWEREAQLRREIALEVYLAEHGHPLQNTIAGLLGALGVIALAVMSLFWASEDESDGARAPGS